MEELLYNHLHLRNSKFASVWRFILQSVWNNIEDYLTDAEKIRNFLIKADPRNEELFSKPENIAWLNEVVRILYDELYEFTWMEKSSEEITNI